MQLDRFIQEIDLALGRRWSEDRENQAYTDDEAKVAAVLTRMDVGLSASILGYNAKMLTDIKNGVWMLVVVGIANILVQFV